MSKDSQVTQLSRLIVAFFNESGLNEVLAAARRFTDDSSCLDPQCVKKECVLNKAFAKFDSEVGP